MVFHSLYFFPTHLYFTAGIVEVLLAVSTATLWVKKGYPHHDVIGWAG